MAEPARRYDPDIEPDIRPNLRVVQGGGDSSSGRGNLSSVSNDTADNLRNREAASNSNVYDISSGRKLSPDDAATRNSDDVSGRESNPNPNWATNLSIDKKKKDAKAQAKAKKKKALALIGVGGATGGILAAFMFLLPLKLEAFYENILKHAEVVPERAVENRADYLIQHTIAARAARVAGLANADMLFCAKGGIACSLYKTYTTDFIEKRYDLKITDEPGKTGVIKFETTSRNGLGGKGYQWEVTYRDVDANGIEDVYKKTFETNKEARAWAKEFHLDRMPSEGGVFDRMKGVITRFIARKVFMKKEGITTWRGFPEKIGANITDIKSTFSSTIIRNSVGLLSEKFGVYMACIMGSQATCEKTLQNVSPDSDVAQKLLGESSDDITSGAEKLSAQQMTQIYSTLMETTAGKIATKAIPIIGWGLLIDMFEHMVLSVDSGVVDRIVSDMVTSVYVAYAFGNDTGIVTNIDKWKNGGLNMNTLSVMSDMFDGAEKSPLFAAENGVTNTAMASMFGGNAYAVSGSGTSDNNIKCSDFFGLGQTSIPKGQLMCDSQKITRNVTGFLYTTPGLSLWWSQEVATAKVWVKTLGPIANIINDTIGFVIKWGLKGAGWIIKLNPITGKILDLSNQVVGAGGQFIGSYAEKFLKYVFEIPTVGVNATGDQNYVALSGGIRDEANETMANGQDSDGTPDGSGGQYLDSDQVKTLVDEYNASQPKPSYLASLFSPNVEGSLTQQFALMMPTSGTDIISSLLNSPGAILASLSHPTFAADNGVSSAVANNPFDLVQYGYPANDPAFTADPNTYTPEYCQQSAAARESDDSLKKVDGVPYKVYTKSDPCALEKTVVGSLLIDAGNTTDPNSLKDPAPIDGSGSDTTQNPSTGNSSEPYGDQDPKQIAQQLLPYISSGKISCSTTQASNCPEIQDVAKGVSIKDSTCAVDALRPELLGVLLTAAKAGNTFTINAICKGHGIIKTAANPQGWTMHPLGDAADIGVINGQSLWGGTNISKITPFYTAINAVYKPGQILYNQYECHANMSVFDGYKEGEVGDACNHQHLQTDTTTAIDAIPPGPGNWSGPKPSWWTG